MDKLFLWLFRMCDKRNRTSDQIRVEILISPRELYSHFRSQVSSELGSMYRLKRTGSVMMMMLMGIRVTVIKPA